MYQLGKYNVRDAEEKNQAGLYRLKSFIKQWGLYLGIGLKIQIPIVTRQIRWNEADQL